jgi:hypothetical protein
MANEQYAWSDYRVFIGGRFVTGIRGFKYGTTHDKEPIYAEGNKPHSMGRGNIGYKCELKCLQSELEAIIISAGGSPTELAPFTVVHSYARKSGGTVVTDIVVDVEFTDIEKAMDQGAKFMEVSLPCVCMDVIYNAPITSITAVTNP